MKRHLQSRTIRNLPMDVKQFLSKCKRSREENEDEPSQRVRSGCVLCGRKKKIEPLQYSGIQNKMRIFSKYSFLTVYRRIK